MKAKEPAWAADEDVWKRAKKAVDPGDKGKKYDEPWAVVSHVYKKMGGKVRKKKETATSGSGIRVNWKFFAADSFGKTPPKKTLDKPEPKAQVVTADDTVKQLILDHPDMNASALYNAIKAKGIAFQDKLADSGSSNAAQLRAQESNKVVVKPRESMTIQCRVLESSAQDNGVGHTRFKTVLLQEGLGNLKDAFYYTRECLEKAIPLFEGKKIYADHPDKEKEVTLPERSVRDVLGHFENVKLEESEGRGMLTADVVILPDEPYRWARALMRHAVEYAKQYPAKDFVGISINAGGSAQPLGVEEFLKETDIPKEALLKVQEAISQGVTEIRRVSELTHAVSADLVTEAGAGGKILQMLEMEKSMGSEKKKEAEGEEGKKKEDGAAAGHGDEQQDMALIKKMLKDYVGEEECESEEAVKHAKQAVEAYKEMGYKEDEAMKCAGHAMKLAKHMAAKQAESEADEDEDKDKKKEAEEKKESEGEEKKESAATVELKGENARLKEALRKYKLGEYLDKKMKESKLPVKVTEQFREALGQPKNEAEIDKAWASFMKGYALRESAPETDSLFVMTEKTVRPEGEAKGVSFTDCLA